jgi:hypothetical protein
MEVLMHRVERSQDEDRRIGEYWDRFDISAGRINAALRRAKEDARRAAITLEAFLQGELINHDLDPEPGAMYEEAGQLDAILADSALSVIDIIRDRVERLEAGS